MVVDSFLALTAALPEAFFLVSETGEIIAANRIAEQMLGADMTSLQGQKITAFLVDPSEKVSSYIRLCFRNSSLVPGSLTWLGADGCSIACCAGGCLIDPGSTCSPPHIILRCEPKTAADKSFSTLNKSLEQLTALYHRLETQSVMLRNEITERQRIEEELRKSSELLRLAFEEAPVGICILDDRGRFLKVNSMMCVISGYSEDELLARTFGDITHPEDLPGNLELYQSMERGEIPGFEIEKRYVRSDNHIIRVLVRISLVHDPASRPYAVAQVVDITARKEAEDALRESRQFIRQILDTSTSMIWVKDGDGRFLLVNKAFADFSGTASEEIIGRHNVEVHCHPEEVACFLDADQEVIRTGRTIDMVEPCTKPNGDIAWWHTIKTPLVQPDGTVNVLAIASDVTEWKRAEEALRESEQKYRILIDTTDTGYVIFDEEGRVLDANEEYARLTGLEAPQRILGRKVTEWTAEHDRIRNAEEVRKCLDRGWVRNLEIDYVNEAGRFIPVELNAAVLKTAAGTRIVALCRDATERRNAEEKLKITGAYNRSLIEASLDPLVTIDAGGKITDVNAATEKVTGYLRSDLIGMDFSDYFTEPEKAEEVYQLVFREGTVRDYELDILHRDGHTTPVLYNASVYRDAAGTVIGIFAAARDITERKKAEEEILRLNAELEQRVIERTAQLAAALDESRHRQAEITALLIGSRAVLKNSEFAAAARAIFDACAQLVGATAYIALLSEDEAKNEVIVMESGGVPCEVDRSLPIPVRGLRGEVFRTGNALFHNDFTNSEWAEFMPPRHIRLENVLFAPMIIDSKVVGLLGMANKPGAFTDHESQISSAFCEIAAIALHNSRSLESLENSEERFRSVAQSATDAIISIDGNGIISFWNDAAIRIFGYGATDVIGKPLSRILPERFREDHQHRVEHVVKTGKTSIIGKVVEMVGLRKDGSEFPLELSLSTWKTREGTFFTGIARDITGRKQSEEAIRNLNEDLERRAAQLEAANKELEAFAYSVSHDLRAPLRSIDGFSQALLEDCLDKLDERGKDYLRRVRNGTQRMALLIDDILKLSRITRAEMKRQVVDLSAMAHSIAEELVTRSPGREVEFVVMDGLTATGDPQLLRAVLENLLGNAWKFTGMHPKARIEFSAVVTGGKPVYFVRDDGAGFDMEYAGNLFVPFQRLHAYDEFEGTGIGLSIVQRIIQRHGGEVWAKGEVEKGATFYFTLDSVKPSASG